MPQTLNRHILILPALTLHIVWLISTPRRINNRHVFAFLPAVEFDYVREYVSVKLSKIRIISQGLIDVHGITDAVISVCAET